MLFYQASALIEKRLSIADLPMAQVDTLCGTIVTQLVMGAVLITFAVQAKGRDIENLPMGEVFLIPLRPLLGEHLTLLLMGAGLLGASLLASLVVSLGVAWNLTEYLGGAMQDQATKSPCFRVFFISTVMLGALVVSSQWVGMVKLNIIIQLINGVLMPLVVGFVFYLAIHKSILPEKHRIRGARALLVALLVVGCAVGSWRLAFECIVGSNSV
jgi:Mn2+/Fe2+ NRAMP family transporter